MMSAFSKGTVILAVVCLAAAGCASDRHEAAKNRVSKEEAVAQIPAEALDSLNAASDNRHVAFVVKEGNKQVVAWDEKLGKGYDEVASIIFSADGKRLMYGARLDKKWLVVVDGKESPRFDGVAALSFSPDGKTAIYAPRIGGKTYMWVNGQTGPRFETTTFMLFSPDGRHMTYSGKIGDQWTVFVDGKPGPRGEEVSAVVFTSDGRWAYRVRSGNQDIIVTDGGRIGVYPLAGDPVFSPDGKQLAYSVVKDVQEMVLVNGVPEKAYDGIVPESVAFAADGTLGYFARHGKQWLAVVGGRESKAYDTIDKTALVLAPAGKHYAFLVNNNSKMSKQRWFVVHDGQDGQPHEVVEKDKLAFSPDGSRLAYVVKDEDSYYVILDGKNLGGNVFAGKPVFSPDSRQVAYVVVRGGRAAVACNGRILSRYDDAWPPVFSSDGKHLAYIGCLSQIMVLNADGKESKRYASIVEGSLNYLSPSEVNYLALQGDKTQGYKILRVTEDLAPMGGKR
jgi:roadblock/LC7 domain-containing protein